MFDDTFVLLRLCEMLRKRFIIIIIIIILRGGKTSSSLNRIEPRLCFVGPCSETVLQSSKKIFLGLLGKYFVVRVMERWELRDNSTPPLPPKREKRHGSYLYTRSKLKP